MPNILTFLFDFIQKDWSNTQLEYTEAGEYRGKPYYTVKGQGVVPDGILIVPEQKDNDETDYLFYQKSHPDDKFGDWLLGYKSLSQMQKMLNSYNESFKQRLLTCLTVNDDFPLSDDYKHVIHLPQNKSVFIQSVLDIFKLYTKSNNNDNRVLAVLQEIQSKLDFKEKGRFTVSCEACWGTHIILYSINDSVTRVVKYNVDIEHARPMSFDYDLIHSVTLIENIIEAITDAKAKEFINLTTIHELETIINQHGQILLGSNTTLKETDMLFKAIDVDYDDTCNKVAFQAQQIGMIYGEKGVLPNFNVNLPRFETGYIKLSGYDEAGKPFFACRLNDVLKGKGLWLTVINQ